MISFIWDKSLARNWPQFSKLHMPDRRTCNRCLFGRTLTYLNKARRPCLGFNLALLFPKKTVSHREGNNAEPNSGDGRLDFRSLLRSAVRGLIFMISG